MWAYCGENKLNQQHDNYRYIKQNDERRFDVALRKRELLDKAGMLLSAVEERNAKRTPLPLSLPLPKKIWCR